MHLELLPRRRVLKHHLMYSPLAPLLGIQHPDRQASGNQDQLLALQIGINRLTQLIFFRLAGGQGCRG